MSTPRRIVVDDTDSSIDYSANQWFPQDPSSLNSGNLGPIWNNTSHSTSSNGATMSFAFNGTAIDIWGTLKLAIDAEGNSDPTWTCLVDGIAITSTSGSSFQFQENNWRLCNQTSLTSGPHTLKIDVQSKGQPFYLDSIIYTPTPDVSYDGAVLEYPSGDPAITYGPGWQFYPVEDTENLTQTHGSHVSIDFHGTAVTLTGFIPHELPHNATTATYAVDGGAATAFTLAGLAADSNTTLFDIPLFTVGSLTPGDHKVVVTYEGDSTKTPLGVKTFYVTNSTTGALSSSPSSSSSSAASGPGTSGTSTASSGSPTSSRLSDTSAAVPKHRSSTGAIAGGVVGGLALLVVLAALLLWCRRRRRQPRHDPAEPFTIEAAAAGAAPASVPFAQRAPFLAGGGKAAGTAASSNTSPTTYASTASLSRSGSGAVSGPGTSAAAGEASEAPSHASSKAALLAPERPVVVQRHQDSGVRLTPSMRRRAEREPEVIELPPDYSQD